MRKRPGAWAASGPNSQPPPCLPQASDQEPLLQRWPPPQSLFSGGQAVRLLHSFQAHRVMPQGAWPWVDGIPPVLGPRLRKSFCVPGSYWRSPYYMAGPGLEWPTL